MLYNPYKSVTDIIEHIDTSVIVENEKNLQTLWVLTCLIAPFCDLWQTLSNWAQSNDVEVSVADKYVMELFSTLACFTRKDASFNF